MIPPWPLVFHYVAQAAPEIAQQLARDDARAGGNKMNNIGPFKLKYHVTIYRPDGEPTSECRFPTEDTARERFSRAIISAPCANVGRVTLSKVAVEMGSRHRIRGITTEYIEDWRPEPDYQVEGYVVHSVRTLNDTTTCRPINREFFTNECEALDYAKEKVRARSGRNEGAVVLKAVAHVRKVPSCTTLQTRLIVKRLDK